MKVKEKIAELGNDLAWWQQKLKNAEIELHRCDNKIAEIRVDLQHWRNVSGVPNPSTNYVSGGEALKGKEEKE